MKNKNKKDCKATEMAEDRDDENEVEYSGTATIGVGYVATESATQSAQQAAVKFAKPNNYTGNRKLYDSPTAKVQAKIKAFNGKESITDPYTGDKLVMKRLEAKRLYPKDWQNHVAETDHIKPIEQIHNQTKSKPWITVEDIKDAANSKANIKVVSRKYNNAKRGKTNKEFVSDTEYLEKTDVRLTKSGKQAAIADGELAEKAIASKLKTSARINVVKTGHDAGMYGAKTSGLTALTMSGIMNTVSVIKEEKEVSEAFTDTVADGGKAAIAGYTMSGGITLVSHTLANSSKQWLQKIASSNTLGKGITTAVVMGDTIIKRAKGEISTKDCLLELGNKGVNLVAMEYSMALGQAVIPIPVVGAAIGGLAGSFVASNGYNLVVETVNNSKVIANGVQKVKGGLKSLPEKTRRIGETLRSGHHNNEDELEEAEPELE